MSGLMLLSLLSLGLLGFLRDPWTLVSGGEVTAMDVLSGGYRKCRDSEHFQQRLAVFLARGQSATSLVQTWDLSSWRLGKRSRGASHSPVPRTPR